MEFDQLRTLLHVLEHGSFTRAAEVLGISQSTVSFQIKSLEQAVGVKLIDRRREGVVATVHGRTLRQYANRILALRTEAQSSMQALDEGLVGHVTIAASTIPGSYFLPPALAELRQSHPGVSATVSVSDSGRAVADLVAGDADLALVGGSPKNRRVKIEAFAQDEVVAVVRAGASLPPPGDLSGMPLVLRREGSGTRAATADALAQALSGREPGATIEVDSTEGLKRCVLSGLGLGFVSRVAIGTELERGLLAIAPIEGTPIKRDFYVATRKGASLSPAASALVEILIGTRL